jgi:hypothetical protein
MGDFDGVRPDALYLTSAQLVADICRRYGMPCDDAHVAPHNRFAATRCPDALDRLRIIRMANEILTIPVAPAPAPAVAGTPIMGHTVGTPRQMYLFLERHAPVGLKDQWTAIISAYDVIGQQEGVRADGGDDDHGMAGGLEAAQVGHRNGAVARL